MDAAAPLLRGEGLTSEMKSKLLGLGLGLTMAAATNALPFTGADIEGMAAIGAGALVAGGLMVRRSRRVRRAAA
jgi:hypothetical protein